MWKWHIIAWENEKLQNIASQLVVKMTFSKSSSCYKTNTKYLSQAIPSKFKILTKIRIYNILAISYRGNTEKSRKYE